MDYINNNVAGRIGPTSDEKCYGLLIDGAIEIKQPRKWRKNLVCVADNGEFGAAAYVRDEYDFERCSSPYEKRQLRWFIWNKVEKYID